MKCEKCIWCERVYESSHFMYYSQNKEVMSNPVWVGTCIRFPKWQDVRIKTHYCGEFKEKQNEKIL